MSARKQAATAATEAVVYVGPSLKGVAYKGTTYNNGLPKELEQAIKETPVLGSLLVPVSQLSEALREINTKQGAYYEFYKAVQKGA